MPFLTKPKKNKVRSVKVEDRKKIYNTRKWMKLRKAQLLQHPLCQECLKNNIITPAVDVHHIISFMSVTDPLKRLYIAYNPSNLLSLCKQCHQKIHQNANKSPH